MKLNNQELFLQECLIGNKWSCADNKKILKVINPANEKKVGEVPDMGINETKRAIQAAHQALNEWKSTSAQIRSRLLNKWHDLIIENLDDLATILTTEQGKPLIESKGEIKYAASFIKWFAEEALRVYGTTIPSHIKNSKILVNKEPIGVSAIITPWNFPAAMITRKVAAALAAGCTAIIKPSEETPLSALALVKLAQEAGIKNGLLNVITGNPQIIGKELSTNPQVRKLSFTGSTRVGKLLMSDCAHNIKKLSLELGGNAPFIIFEDANLEKAIKGVIASKFRNSGQTCVCANRIFVHQNIEEEFTEKLIIEVKKLNVGNGLEKNITQGPLINQKAINRLEELIDDAVKKKGKVILGGKKHQLGGLFFKPTIVNNAKPSMRLFKEEIFGPILPIFKFNNENEVIKMANDTNYGLASYLYSQNIGKAWQIAEKLEYGMVGVNECAISSPTAPFGGIKESGIGREGSFMGIDEYTETKYILMSL